MNVLIDLTALCRRLTGIEYYTLHLAKALLENECEYRFVLVFRKTIHKQFSQFKNLKNVKILVSPFKSQILTEQIYVPYLTHRLHTFHSLFSCFPPGFFCKRNYTIVVHDATMWMFPKTLSFKNKIYFRPLVSRAIRNAKFILTNSQTSYADVSVFFPVMKDKGTVIGASINEGVAKIDCRKAVVINGAMGVTGRYLLCVGSIEPRKNFPFIIESVISLLKTYNLKMVVVGRFAWGNSDLLHTIKKEQADEFVKLVGYINNEQLCSLYSNAECFLFPSLYEGFGLPILEAFACECPVITSNVGSMPEVAGDAALQISPHSKNELCAAIINIVENRGGISTELVKRGLLRLKLFSWKNAASKACKIMSMMDA